MSENTKPPEFKIDLQADDPDGCLLATARLLLRTARSDRIRSREALDQRNNTIKDLQLRICHLESHAAILRGERDHYREDNERLRDKLDGRPTDRPAEPIHSE